MSGKASAEKRKPFFLSAFLGSIQLGLVASVLIGALVLNRFLAISGEKTAPVVNSTRPPLVEIIQPDAGAEQVAIVETGVIEARTEVAIAPEVGGRVISVASDFAAGGAFKAGEILFEINPADYQLQVQQAQAEVNTAKSALSLEEAEAASAVREWRLINGDEPVPPLVAREPQMAQARAGVETAEARLAVAKLDLSRTSFSLPFNGRVLSTTIESGLAVNPNQSYGTVYADASVEAVVSLPPEDIALLNPIVGRDGVITVLSGPGEQVIDAKVIRIESALDDHSRLASIILGLDQSADIIPGAFIEARLLGPTLDALVRLPAETVSPTGMVWVIENNALQYRPVSIVSRSDEFVLARAFDMADGVVAVPPAGARPGLEVRLAEEEPGGSLATAAAGER